MVIQSLQLENVKRVKAVEVQPSPAGLTVIGGRNGQGKTSVLDGIAWALGGSKYQPSSAHREGSVTEPYIRIQLSNGLVVERKGKNSALTVTDPEGKRGGQKLLDSFISTFALDISAFLESSDKDKANILLKIIGVGDQLQALDAEEKKLYDERRALYPVVQERLHYAEVLPEYPEAPEEKVSVSDLIRRQQDIVSRNRENQRKKEEVVQIDLAYRDSKSKLALLMDRLTDLQQQIKVTEEQVDKHAAQLEQAQKVVDQLVDESTDEVEQALARVEDDNRKVDANLAKSVAKDAAHEMELRYEHMSDQINVVRKEKEKLLEDAQLPLPELSVVDGALAYKGRQWDCMSGSEQLMVATAIVRKLKPECGFVLLDKLEQMDVDTLKDFGAWLEQEGLQAIATRVSTGEECQIIIEDGMVKGVEPITRSAKMIEEDMPW